MDTSAIPFIWADVPGHAAFLLIAISYYLTNIYWLRVIAVIGLSLEIVYFNLAGGAMHHVQVGKRAALRNERTAGGHQSRLVLLQVVRSLDGRKDLRVGRRRRGSHDASRWCGPRLRLLRCRSNWRTSARHSHHDHPGQGALGDQGFLAQLLVRHAASITQGCNDIELGVGQPRAAHRLERKSLEALDAFGQQSHTF